MSPGGRIQTPYESSVFINCPFDDRYVSLLRPLLFTAVYLRFEPRIASETSDSAEMRFDKIVRLIRSARLSIHDISRMRAESVGELSRLNLAFELGMDRGAQLFGSGRLRSKCCLVLERDPHEFRRALSDLSGIDIKSHGDQPPRIVRAVRDWFVETVGVKGAPSSTSLWSRFTEFTSDFYDTRVADGYSGDDLNMMPVPEYIDSIRIWRERKG